MTRLQIFWEDNALKLLEGRDRYTRNAIRRNFAAIRRRTRSSLTRTSMLF